MSNRALAFTAERLLQILESFPPVGSYVVGFSGGADSTALLHALLEIRGPLDIPVSAVHVNHGIHPESDSWQQQCERFCRRHQVELTCLKIKLTNRSGKGLEAEARQLRYEAISKLITPADCLLTAHHSDDQAETLLLNLMRGSGVEGLTAMPDSRPFESGCLQRPLLHFTNSALKDYLFKNKLEWIEDPSNQYLNHDRNFVRHEVVPLLEKRWPGVSQRLLLTQEAMTDARHLLEGLADEYLASNLSHPFVLRITPQCIAKSGMLRLVVRYWVKQSGTPGIPAYKLVSFCAQVQQATGGHNVLLHWDGWLLRWYKNQLWLQPDSLIRPCPTMNWPANRHEINLGDDIGKMVLGSASAADNISEPSSDFCPDGEFSIGARMSMEENAIHVGGIHKSLKNIFQSAGIPPWLRDSIPLCKLDGELVAIGDWCFSERFQAGLSKNAASLNWRPLHPLLRYIRKQQHGVKH